MLRKLQGRESYTLWWFGHDEKQHRDVSKVNNRGWRKGPVGFCLCASIPYQMPVPVPRVLLPTQLPANVLGKE